MLEFLLIRAEDARRVPWKNGRGITEEIAVGPAGATFEAGDFAWRVSRASVAEPGPFSAFPGIDRVLVVTHGEGLLLTHGTGRAAVPVSPLAPHRFSGDEATTAALVGGAVRDFNVLTRRGVARADVEVLRGAARLFDDAGAAETLIHAVGAPGLAAGRTLAPGETLRVREGARDASASPARFDLVPGPGGALLVVWVHLDTR